LQLLCVIWCNMLCVIWCNMSSIDFVYKKGMVQSSFLC
jgi:hypothetical protein